MKAETIENATAAETISAAVVFLYLTGIPKFVVHPFRVHAASLPRDSFILHPLCLKVVFSLYGIRRILEEIRYAP